MRAEASPWRKVALKQPAGVQREARGQLRLDSLQAFRDLPLQPSPAPPWAVATQPRELSDYFTVGDASESYAHTQCRTTSCPNTSLARHAGARIPCFPEAKAGAANKPRYTVRPRAGRAGPDLA